MANYLSFNSFYFNVPSDANCSICLEPAKMNVTGSVVAHADPKTNKYLHFFHRNCVRTWADTHTTCPNCQAPIERVSLNSFSDRLSALSEKAWTFAKPYLCNWGKKIGPPLALYVPVGLKILEDAQVMGPVFGINSLYRWTTFLAGVSPARNIENKGVLFAGILSLAAIFALDPMHEGCEGLRFLAVNLLGGHLAGIAAAVLDKYDERIKHFLAPLLATNESSVFLKRDF